MNNDQIIQKIKNENLKPISKNVFLMRKIFIWFSLLISTIFGTYAFACLFLRILYIDFENWHYLNNSYEGFLMKNIPIIWIALFIMSLFFVSYLFKKTNKGYKYSIILIAIISLTISFLSGLALSKFFIQKNLLIDNFENERIMNWTNPKSGLLSGEVLFVDDKYILLRDINDDIWNIDINNILDNSRDVLNDNVMISVIGKYDYENNFTACQIIPLNMDRIRFKPNPVNRFYKNIDNDNDFVNQICNFVIN